MAVHTKKKKRVRLESLPKKRRRLMKLWTSKVHSIYGGRCAVCGKIHGSVDAETGRTSYMNAHHIEPRATCAALRYDPMNGILLCPSCHKFGRNSAHKGSIWFITWLHDNRPDQYQYVLKHRDDIVDINNREYLDSVEASLKDCGSENKIKVNDNECKCECRQGIGEGAHGSDVREDIGMHAPDHADFRYKEDRIQENQVGVSG